MYSSANTSTPAVVVPLGIGAGYLQFVSSYGAAILTTLGIVYTGFNIFLRVNEYLDKRRAIKKVAEEAARVLSVKAGAQLATAAIEKGLEHEQGSK